MHGRGPIAGDDVPVAAPPSADDRVQGYLLDNQQVEAGQRFAAFGELFDPKDTGRERPGSFQSCTIANRLDYILFSPELAAKVTGGGVFRKGLWGAPANKNPPQLWSVYPELTAAKHGASDHAAVWVDLDL